MSDENEPSGPAVVTSGTTSAPGLPGRPSLATFAFRILPWVRALQLALAQEKNTITGPHKDPKKLLPIAKIR